MGPHADGDVLSMISPDFEENTGQPTCLQNGPFLLANRGVGLPQLSVKLMPSGGGVGMMPKCGILSRDYGSKWGPAKTVMGFPRFPRILRKIMDNPRLAKVTLFVS